MTDKTKGKHVGEKEARAQLEAGYPKAEKVLNDPDELEKTLRRLEEKLKTVPVAGGPLSNVPVMISLVRSYISQDYPNIPIGTIVAVVSALLYFLSPIDLIPDFTPLVGYVDDTGVVAACLALAQSDIDEYKAWRDAR